MTATERLRELLDERGVEWWYGYNEKSTVFDGEHDVRYEVDGVLDLLFLRSALDVTPEQAIAATLGHESYGKDAEQVERAEPGEMESYDQLKAKYDELCELTREMWTFTELVNISGRLSNGGAWNAAEFGKRMRELGVIE